MLWCADRLGAPVKCGRTKLNWRPHSHYSAEHRIGLNVDWVKQTAFTAAAVVATVPQQPFFTAGAFIICARKR